MARGRSRAHRRAGSAPGVSLPSMPLSSVRASQSRRTRSWSKMDRTCTRGKVGRYNVLVELYAPQRQSANHATPPSRIVFRNRNAPSAPAAGTRTASIPRSSKAAHPVWRLRPRPQPSWTFCRSRRGLQPPLDLVSGYGISEPLAYGEAESRGRVASPGDNHQSAIRSTLAFAPDRREVAGLSQATLGAHRWQVSGVRASRCPPVGEAQTVNLWRPLNIRLFRTLLPLLVRILALNPWTRMRRLLLVGRFVSA